MNKKILLKLCLLSTCLSTVSSAVATQPYHQYPEAQTYIEQLAKQYQFDKASLLKIFKEVKKQERAIKAMDSPAENKPWYEYKKLFVSDANIKNGLAFYQEHSQLLNQIEQHYQVPKEILVAIAGIESHYGKHTGYFPILDTLVTLSFDYPRREAFYRQQLTEMLLLIREEQLDYKNLKGSYAGAMGIGQFIPSSYRAYAVDFDEDGQRDLWGSLADALASIANYLNRHGWQKGDAIATRLPQQIGLDDLPFNQQLKPWLTVAELQQHHAITVHANQPQFSLFSYKTSQDSMEYWATYYNFYVISRYNHSALYSMAVYQLSQSLINKKDT